MSYTIRSFIRGILLENVMQEAVPSAPPDADLNEAPPPAPDENETAGSQTAPRIFLSARLPAKTAAPVDTALEVYMQEAIGYIVENDTAIGAACDLFMEGITGGISPEEIMSIYAGAKLIDIKHGHHDPDGHDKNWTVLLLGLAISATTGTAIINSAPEVMKAAENAIRRINNALQPSGIQERAVVRRNKKILSEGVTIGSKISKIVKKLSGESAAGSTLENALSAEARDAASAAAKNLDELEDIIMGLEHANFNNKTLGEYVRAQARNAIEAKSLGQIGDVWAQSAQAELRALGIPDPKISDLINPPRGTSLTYSADLQRNNLIIQLDHIDSLNDDFFKAVVNNDSFKAAFKLKAQGTGRGIVKDLGVDLLRGGGSLAKDMIIKLTTGLLALASGSGALYFIASEVMDAGIPVDIDPELIVAITEISDGTERVGNEKIAAVDIWLKTVHTETGRFLKIRSKLTQALDEYWFWEFLDRSECAQFIKILQKGPYGT